MAISYIGSVSAGSSNNSTVTTAGMDTSNATFLCLAVGYAVGAAPVVRQQRERVGRPARIQEHAQLRENVLLRALTRRFRPHVHRVDVEWLPGGGSIGIFRHSGRSRRSGIRRWIR